MKDSQTGKNIAFANVTLQLQADTTKNYSGSLTDLEGNFSLDNVPTNLIELSCLIWGIRQ